MEKGKKLENAEQELDHDSTNDNAKRSLLVKIIDSLCELLLLPSLLLAWIGGSDLAVIKNQPTSEINKKATLGFAVVAAGSVAGIAGGYAAQQYFGLPITLGGFVWAMLIIFAIDRPIIVFMDNMKAKSLIDGTKDSSFKIAAVISTRVILVLVVSYLTSTILEIKIFSVEVNTKIEQKAFALQDSLKMEKYARIDSVQDEIVALGALVQNAESSHKVYLDKLYADYEAAEAIVIALQQELIDEVQGEIGSGKKGDGPAADAIRTQIVAAQKRARELKTEFDNAQSSSLTASSLESAKEEKRVRKETLEKKIQLIESDLEKGIAEIQKNATKGFRDQYFALKEVGKDAPLLMIAVMMAIMLIELLPMILKQLSGSGTYEEDLAIQYREYSSITQSKRNNEILDIERKGNEERLLIQRKLYDNAYKVSKEEGGHLVKINTALSDVSEAKRNALENEKTAFLNMLDIRKEKEIGTMDAFDEMIKKLNVITKAAKNDTPTTRDFKEAMAKRIVQSYMDDFDLRIKDK